MKIHPDQIEEGMRLAEDVVDINYRLLIPEGERIEKRHIRVLKIWGIQEVEIAGTDDALGDPGSPDYLDAMMEAEKTGREIFRFVDTRHPAIKEILRLSIEHRSLSPQFLKPDRLLKKDPPALKKFNHPIPAKIQSNNIKLPESPVIITELNKVIENPYTSASDISKIVNRSASLSAILLRIVNSAFYNFPEKIDSISWAVTLIGAREIVNLAYGITIMEVFKDIPREMIDVRSFIRHSLFCGILSRILGAHKNIIRTEQLFVSGLLHDIGRLVVFKYYPEQSLALLSTKERLGRPLFEIEREFGGINHTHVGYYLMKKWNLPKEIVDNIFHHHSPSQAPAPVKPAILHVADIIANGLGIGTSGESNVPRFDRAAWDSLGIAPALFETAVRQALHQIKFLGIFTQG